MLISLESLLLMDKLPSDGTFVSTGSFRINTRLLASTPGPFHSEATTVRTPSISAARGALGTRPRDRTPGRPLQTRAASVVGGPFAWWLQMLSLW